MSRRRSKRNEEDALDEEKPRRTRRRVIEEEEIEERPRKRTTKRVIEEEEEEDEELEDVENEPAPEIDARTAAKLKAKINEWLDYDEHIKEMTNKMKKYKDAKKKEEESIITMITNLGMDQMKIDVHDKKGAVRGRVYRQKSVTKEALKESIIKDALMEGIRDEKTVNQLLKKIDSKRPVKERYYLKRTKGSDQ